MEPRQNSPGRGCLGRLGKGVSIGLHSTYYVGSKGSAVGSGLKPSLDTYTRWSRLRIVPVVLPTRCCVAMVDM